MVNKKLWLGLLVMLLVFGILVVGCDTGNNPDNGNNTGNGEGGKTDPALNGTWIGNYSSMYEWTFNNGSYEIYKISEFNQPFHKGTYTTNGNRYTREVTHSGQGCFSYLEPSKWYSKNELLDLNASAESDIENSFKTLTAIYSIDGDILTLSFEGSSTPEILTKK